MFFVLGATYLHTIQMFMRLVIYVVIGTAVLVVRHRHRKRNEKRMDRRTKKMMKNTPRDENGKYPWEK
ncbi:hypothetical protein ABTQ33_01050 [Paucilactobacillus suebicus]|uniref:Uncharacterized protein n=1 Tax=Paucilactobacillus suebicus DSM 5007 = KCTC 3549 TaxID=1423807 RepID=A0A0R1W824_9LACO|nr:hypothetical protein [Paucilactobacillus suebicus]KRM12020.1 hypothetical protein FD16_GL000389 [Paucilactobacillus suebicus DSM 5007 = KCTC 3549]